MAGHPGRFIVEPLRRHYRARYHKRHDYPRLIFTLDILLVGVLAGFAIALAAFLFFNRNAIARQIDFSATVAPTIVSSGAPSTLVFTWHNTSTEKLRDVVLDLSYPDHFLLQEIVYLDEHVESLPTGQAGGRIVLGVIPPDGMGSLKVRGVMFGNVGGTQTFGSTLEFRYGNKRNRQGVKETTHTFEPTASALAIDAVIADTLISEQLARGTIRLTNTGPIDFGAITIIPAESVFDFSIVSGNSVRLENGSWIIPQLPSGASVDLAFDGRTPKTEKEIETDWSFSASFTFDESVYFQGKTVQTFTLIPSPLVLEDIIDTPILTPGGTLSVSGNFRNISDEPLSNLVFFLEGDSPFLARRDGKGSVYDTREHRWEAVQAEDALDPGEEGSFRFDVPVRTSVSQSATSQYENFSARINLGAEFKLPSIDASASVRTAPVALPITSPIRVSSFGRYSTLQGDQIGRGPLPPVVGEETKYWIFWNISGTTNTLKNVEITAVFPPNVRAGDKQSVSTGRMAQFDNGMVSWTIDELPPTFAPGSKTVGIAFEVAVVPSADQAGQMLALLDHVRLTAVDAFTGELIQAYGARITTDLPNDAMASGLDRVIN